MAFSPPSHQRSYTLISSLDPALNLPPLPALAEDASPDDKAAAEKLIEERQHKLKVARDHGQWSPLIKPGEKPTEFHCRPIHGPLLNWLRGEVVRRKLTEPEIAELAIRVGLERVENPKIDLAHERIDGFTLITLDSLVPLYSFGRETGDVTLGPTIVLEIGGLIWERAIVGVRPLS